MVIMALDHVPHCYTAQDGLVIASLIRAGWDRGEKVVLSLAGVTDAPSSFVNGAFVSLLDTHSFDAIRRDLRIIDSTRQINDLILHRMQQEAARTVAA